MKSFRILSIPFFLFSLFILSCSNNEDNTNYPDTDKEITEVPADADLPVGPLASLKDKYPMEVNLLDNPLIKERLDKMLGDDYSDFRKYWEVETPIVVEDSVLATSGCEQHNCAANQYILQIDLRNNNINVYHFGLDSKEYAEKGKINLPKELEEEFNIMKSNTIH